MHTFFNMYGELNSEMLNKFIEAVNANLREDNGPLHIYLNSVGGEDGVAQAILEIINLNPDQYLLAGCGELSSCAFTLFFNANCGRTLLQNCFGMSHSLSMWPQVNILDDHEQNRLAHIEEIKQFLIQEAYEIGFNDKELDRFKSGRDVYFSPSRMRQLLTKQQQRNEKI